MNNFILYCQSQIGSIGISLGIGLMRKHIIKF